MRIIINMRDLWGLSHDQHALVSGFAADLSESFQNRLAALGFRQGQKVRCLGSTPFGGPKIFQIGDSVFSLARDLASGIIIDKSENPT
jgi:Fe2+ transport system protein FeoA